MFLKFGTSCIVFLSPFHVIYIKISSHDIIPLKELRLIFKALALLGALLFKRILCLFKEPHLKGRLKHLPLFLFCCTNSSDICM